MHASQGQQYVGLALGELPSCDPRPYACMQCAIVGHCFQWDRSRSSPITMLQLKLCSKGSGKDLIDTL
jgi:hypothetical protein